MHGAYNTYFGFRTPPFSIAASPQFFYKNPLHHEALLSLLFSVQQLRRLILLTGPPGTGKTTLLYQVASQLEPCYQVLYVPHCPQRFADLLVTTGRYSEQRSTLFLPSPPLGEILKLYYRLKKRAIVVLDDAHNLSDEALTTLNLLLDLETLSTPLLTLVLAGDSFLETRFHQPALADLQKRIDLHLRFQGLQPEETDSYIAHRVRTAGRAESNLFSPEAIQRITQYSKGVPRLINVFCDNTLQAAQLAGMHAVSAELVDRVAQELFLADKPKLINRPRQVPVVVLPDRQLPAQPKTYPVVVKQGAKHFVWMTLTIFVAWFSLFQLSPLQQPTHHESLRQNAQPVATSVIPSEQFSHMENEASPFASALHSAPQQELKTDQVGFSSMPLENRIPETSGAAVAQQPEDSPPALVLVRSQRSSVSAPQENERTTTSSAIASLTTTRTSRQETAQLQLARLGIPVNRAALFDSVERGDMRVTRLLLTAGVSPNTQDNQGWTPLMCAVQEDRKDLALLLIAHGANVNATNKTRGTALMLAAMNNHLTMVETLIRKGAHVNAKNSQGWTALTYASWKGHSQVVMTLLNKGANTHVKDNLGWTPQQYVSWRQEARPKQEQLYEEIAEALGINLKDEPLTVVSHSDYAAVAHLLNPSMKTP